MIRRIFLLLLLVVGAWVIFEWITFPDVAALATKPPQTTAFMELRKKELRAAGKDDTIQYQFVPYEKISPYLRRGVLVAEDDSFYEHDAVDTEAMKKAIERNWQRRKITHGGSTITQQLAKNLYLSPSRNPVRKIREYFIARSLERHLSKKRILEIYLNVVEMGERVYGAEAASRYYFHRPASALTPQQAALLAGCLPNPRIMNPGAPNKRLRWRQSMVLSRLRRYGYLIETEVLTAKKPDEAPPAPAADTAGDTAIPETPTTTSPEPADTETSPQEVPPAPSTQPPPADTSGTPPPATTTTNVTTTTT